MRLVPFRSVNHWFIRGAAVLASLAGLSVTDIARADSCSGALLSACLNSDTFWPSAGPKRFATLASTETIAPGQFGVGLVATYLRRPIVLLVPTPGPTGTRENAVNDQVNGNFLFGYGVTQRLALHLALPVTFAQGGSGTSSITGGNDLRDTALRDARFGFAYAILREPRVDWERASGNGFQPSATLHFDVSAPTGDRSQFAGEHGSVYAPSVAVGGTLDRLYAGIDVGARLRETSQFAGARIGTQLTLGVGLGGHILKRGLLSASVEARALPTFAEQADTVQTTSGLKTTPNGLHVTPGEWMLVLRSAPTNGGDFVITAGGGTGLPLGEEAVTRPRYRFLLGIEYAPRGLDSDSDGVLDRDDACPDVPGIRVVPPTPEGSDKPAAKRGCPMPREEEGPPVDFVKPSPNLAPTPANKETP